MRGSGSPASFTRSPATSGPTLALLWCADLWSGPAQGTFEQTERVLKIEPAEVGPPQQVQVDGRARRRSVPQPHVLGRSIAGQPLDLDTDHRARHDGQHTLEVGPAGLPGQFLVQPMPRADRHRAVTPIVPVYLLIRDR